MHRAAMHAAAPPGVATDPLRVFDRSLLRARRDRAADGFHRHDFLLREVANRLNDRLLDIARSFPATLCLGSHTGRYGPRRDGKNAIDLLVHADLSPRMAAQAPAPAIVADEEMLPFAGRRFDLVYSNLSLHWVNDLPGALAQINGALRPDGLFLAALPGGATLTELRQSLAQAESEISGGVSPRVSPFIDLRDAGALLQRAGFALPVVDADRITVTYSDAFRLMADLGGMGEANGLHQRQRHPTGRRVFAQTAKIYADNFADADGLIPVTFEIVYLHGWGPDPGQRKPLRPGAPAQSLAEALDTWGEPPNRRKP